MQRQSGRDTKQLSHFQNSVSFGNGFGKTEVLEKPHFLKFFAKTLEN
jgi:hypothetical protein